ncbi:MAG: FAD-dependent oxidoreductase [Desulfobacteraceae bacterium]|nr:FAD-dependent oxidoreductase [Desulfobacteraceae bacterium]
MKQTKQYDIIILGGGIAGLTSAIYTSRAKLRTLILEKNVCGGLVNWAIEIENFPSYEKIGGMEFIEKVKAQVEKLGADIEEIAEIEDIHLTDEIKTIETEDYCYKTKAVIIGTGREPIKLPLETDCEQIHYCAICDGSIYKDRNVLVVGGGNSGVDDSLYLITQGVKHITLIEQFDKLFASQKSQEELKAYPQVDIMTSTEVAEIESNDVIERVIIRNTKTEETKELKVDAIFVYVGQEPKTELFKNVVDMDSDGYILADDDMRTNVEGVFVAGDVRQKKYRQITTAANDGTIAALSAEEYIRSQGQR